MARGNTIEVRQEGTVVQVNDKTVTVEWRDGQQEDVRCPKLAGCKSGQLFEALVQRDRNTYKFKSLQTCDLLEPMPEMTDADADKLWASLPTTAGLPSASWD